MALKILMNQASIVLIGSFNPKIFHPQWLMDKDIIGEFDYDAPYEVSHEFMNDLRFIVNHDITSYNLPDDMQLQVVRNRYNLKSFSEDSFTRIGDITASATTILSETPINKMGLNLSLDVSGFSKDKWKLIGEKLVHMEVLKKSLGIDDEHDWGEKSGLSSIAVILPVTECSANKNNFRISISPRANQYKKEEGRVLEVDINYHYDLGKNGAKKVPALITGEWQTVQSSAKELVSKIFQSTIGETI